MVTKPQRKDIPRSPGVSTQLFSGRFKPRVHLPRIAAAGFVALELCLLSGRDHFDYTNSDAVKELDTVARDLGIAIWSIHEQDIPQCLGVTSTTEQDTATDEIRRCLDLAYQLGAGAIPSHLLMNTAFDTGTDQETEIERRIVERLHRLAPEVRPSGASIAFENTGRRSWARPPAIERRMATLPTDAYGFVLDTGHANLMGDLDVLVETFGSRLLTVHLHDNHAVKGNDEHLPPQKGTVNWAKVRRHLDTVRYRGCLMYEVVGGADPDQVLRDTIGAHRQLFSPV